MNLEQKLTKLEEVLHQNSQVPNWRKSSAYSKTVQASKGLMVDLFVPGKWYIHIKNIWNIFLDRVLRTL